MREGCITPFVPSKDTEKTTPALAESPPQARFERRSGQGFLRRKRRRQRQGAPRAR